MGHVHGLSPLPHTFQPGSQRGDSLHGGVEVVIVRARVHGCDRLLELWDSERPKIVERAESCGVIVPEQALAEKPGTRALARRAGLPYARGVEDPDASFRT
jgi:hypothetical protein